MIETENVVIETSTETHDDANVKADFSKTMRMPERFRVINRLIMRDLNDLRGTPSFYLYNRDKIAEFLRNPYKNQKYLRAAAIYLYGASVHFRRLIQYFVGLSDLAYVVSPYRIDTKTAKPATIGRQYKRTLNLLSLMDIKNQFPKILTVCLREDVFFGTMWITSDSITIQQLPSDYCEIAVIEDNVLNVSFDFSYFDIYPEYLALYPEEFRIKYALYQKDIVHMRYQELDAPNSFAVKCTNDILTYAIPPFAGMFREIYDLEDYKNLKLARTELENYAMLVMHLGSTNGEWDIDYDKAVDFYHNLDSVLPDQVGSVLSPMDITKIGFDHSGDADDDTIAQAEQNLYSAAGVSSLLFNNTKASANALLLAIKVDQSLTFGIVKSLEGVVNRFIKQYPYGRNFKVTFLDVSPFNRKEMGDQYLKACTYGIPMISYYAASQGMLQSELDTMNFLENDVLDFNERFKPLHSSATQSANDVENDGPGRPPKDDDELTEAGEQTREDA